VYFKLFRPWVTSDTEGNGAGGFTCDPGNSGIFFSQGHIVHIYPLKNQPLGHKIRARENSFKMFLFVTLSENEILSTCIH
jgi:hypothetical protein